MSNRSWLHLLVVSMVAGGATACYAQAGGNQPERSIVVQGIGRVAVHPDRVQVQLGVTTQGKTAMEAQAVNAESMRRVIASLRVLGIPEDKVETAFFSINKVVDSGYSEGRFLGGRQIDDINFQASNFRKVTLDGVDQVGRLIDTAIEAGAGEVSLVAFGLKDDSIPRQQATKLAIEDARRKARDLSAAVGVRVGSILSVQDVTGLRPGVSPSLRGEMMGEPNGFNSAQNEVQVAVTVVFKIQ